MSIVFINPNSTASMTSVIVAGARRAVPAGRFEGWTSIKGPPAIQGEADGRIAVPPLIDLVEEADRLSAAAIVLACFDDTGLAEARTITTRPVIGLGQASFHMAGLRFGRFSVVTTLSVSVPVIEANLAALGLTPLCAAVRASGVPVLALETDPTAVDTVAAQIQAAADEDGADCVVLGCAGMTALADALATKSPLPLVDCVDAAARLATALAD